MKWWPFSRAGRGAVESVPSAPRAQAARREPVLSARPAASPERSRGWKSAVPDRLAGGFLAWSPNPRADLRFQHRGLIAHARHAAQNMDMQRAYEMLARRHVVGASGIRLRMALRTRDGSADRARNDAIEKAWRAWGRRGACTLDAQSSWWGVECRAITNLMREGAFLVRLHTGADKGRFGLRIELIAADLLDLDYHQPSGARDGGWIEQGIEYDRDGRIRAVHLLTAHPADAGLRGRSVRQRVPIAQIVLVALPEEIGMTLNAPRSAAALRLMSLISEFQLAAVAAAYQGAAITTFFEQDSPGEMLRGDSAAGAIAPPIDRIEAGMSLGLPPGVRANPHTPHYPDAAVEPFLRATSGAVSASLGVSREALTGDLKGANFSSLRAGKGEERDEWRMLQRALWEGLHMPVFEAWLVRAAMAGAVPVRATEIGEVIDSVNWQPRGWPSVNPKEDALAAQTDLALGLTSRREIAARRGVDIEDVFEEIADEERLAAAVGIDLARPAPAATNASGGGGAGAGALDGDDDDDGAGGGGAGDGRESDGGSDDEV